MVGTSGGSWSHAGDAAAAETACEAERKRVAPWVLPSSFSSVPFQCCPSASCTRKTGRYSRQRSVSMWSIQGKEEWMDTSLHLEYGRTDSLLSNMEFTELLELLPSILTSHSRANFLLSHLFAWVWYATIINTDKANADFYLPHGITVLGIIYLLWLPGAVWWFWYRLKMELGPLRKGSQLSEILFCSGIVNFGWRLFIKPYYSFQGKVYAFG